MSEENGSEDEFFLEENEEEEQMSNEEQSNKESVDDENESIEDENAEKEIDTTEENGKVLGETKPLSKEEIEEYNNRIHRSGVIYLSSVPPYMKPEKVKFLLGQYGEISHMHIVEEDVSMKRRRRKNGGSRKTFYVEGWVEFVDKRKAKQAVQLLNGQIVGGKKSGFYHDCIWNMKYLPGFKWHHLMEKLSCERRLRMDKLRADFQQSRKEDELYLENVHKAETRKIIQQKREKKESESKD